MGVSAEGSQLGSRGLAFRRGFDSRFHYTSPAQRDNISKLLTTARARWGHVLVTGAPGSGKTSLLQRIVEELQDEGALTFYFHSPPSTFDALLAACCERIGEAGVAAERGQRMRALTSFLVGLKGERTVVLLVDEAQSASTEVLKGLLDLAGPGDHAHSLLPLVLAGTPELESHLAQDALRFVAARVGFRYRLQPLDPDQVASFIRHQLKAAGGGDEALFSREAIARVAKYSGGIPKRINALCRLALLAADLDASKRVTAQIVERVVHEVSVADGEPVPAKALSAWSYAPAQQGEERLADAEAYPLDEAIPAQRPEGADRASSPGPGSEGIEVRGAWRRGDLEEPNAWDSDGAEPEVAAYGERPRPAKARRLRQAAYPTMGAGLLAVSLWVLWAGMEPEKRGAERAEASVVPQSPIRERIDLEGDDLSRSVTDAPRNGPTAWGETRESQSTPAYESESEAVLEEIAGLLAIAEEHLQADRLVAPRFDNALTVYLAILRLDPENAEAKDGIDRLKAKLLRYASDAEVQGELEAARSYIMKVLAIDWDDEAARAALATLGP